MDIDELSVLEPAVTGELETPTSGLSDFYGTLVDITLVTDQAQGRKTEDNPSGMYWRRQAKLSIKADPTDNKPEGFMQYAWYSLPTDPTTGYAIRNKDGSLRRPRKDDDWGIFETFLTDIAVPWEGRQSGLLGIHGRWQYKEFPSKYRRTRDGAPVVVRNRFLTEWDRYDNRVRDEKGLPAKTNTNTNPTSTNAPTSNLEEEAINVLDGKGLIQYVGDVQKDFKHLAAYATMDQVQQWERDGRVTKDSSQVYHRS